MGTPQTSQNVNMGVQGAYSPYGPQGNTQTPQMLIWVFKEHILLMALKVPKILEILLFLKHNPLFNNLKTDFMMYFILQEKWQRKSNINKINSRFLHICQILILRRLIKTWLLQAIPALVIHKHHPTCKVFNFEAILTINIFFQ